jgi:hypothetical protein
MPQEDEIFRNGVALLAFVIAFYALVARERKTPDMVHAVYIIAFLVLSAVVLSIVANFLERIFATVPSAETMCVTEKPAWLFGLRLLSGLFLVLGLIYVLYRLLRDWNRLVFFRDDQIFLNTSVGQFISWLRFKCRKKERYETNPMKLAEPLVKSLRESPYLGAEDIDRVLAHYKGAPNRSSISAVFEIPNLIEIDGLLTDLASRFLENDCFVQYASCTRHPIEFLIQLRSVWEGSARRDDWRHVCRRIVAVDAYTPHFGFTDTVYRERREEAEQNCLAFVKSHRTYAGIHTAIANAFNKIKKADIRTPSARTPTLVLYEGCSALIDLESNEQYRIFVRHVLPSERLWGGMFTVFLESDIAAENRAPLKGGADIFVQASKSSGNLNAASARS